MKKNNKKECYLFIRLTKTDLEILENKSELVQQQLLLAFHKGPRRSQRRKQEVAARHYRLFLVKKVAFALLSTGFGESVITHHSACWLASIAVHSHATGVAPSRCKEPTRFNTLLNLAISLIGLLEWDREKVYPVYFQVLHLLSKRLL